MKLERASGGLFLKLGDNSIYFDKAWIEQMRVIPFENIGDYVRKTIYPSLSDEEKKIWFKAQISNKELLQVILDFQ